MAVLRFPASTSVEIDTAAKTVAVLVSIPAADGEGDVVVFRQNVTAQMSVEDRRRLRDALNGSR